MLTPPSGRREFDGIALWHESEIAPWLEEKEKDRRAAVTNFSILVCAFGLLTLALAAFGPFGDANFHLAAVAAMLGAGGALWLLNRTRDDIAAGLLERMAARLGFAYRRSPGRPAAYDAFRRLRLLPNHNRESWEDEVSGERAGAAFVMCEAHLRYKSSGKKSSTRTVFHGQLIALDYHKRFLGTTVILRDAGVLNRLMKPGPEFSRVGLASAEFEKAYEAWSTDQVEARELLDPVVLERFQELERLFCGKRLRAAFTEGRLLIAVETGDRLNMGTMFKPLNKPGRVETILGEFDVIFDLVDVILARVDSRIDGAFSVDHVR